MEHRFLAHVREIVFLFVLTLLLSMTKYLFLRPYEREVSDQSYTDIIEAIVNFKESGFFNYIFRHQLTFFALDYIAMILVGLYIIVFHRRMFLVLLLDAGIA